MLLFGHVETDDTEKFDRWCRSASGRCLRSGRPHLRLEGLTPTGVPWTSVAAAYPTRFGGYLASALTTAATARWAASLV